MREIEQFGEGGCRGNKLRVLYGVCYDVWNIIRRIEH